MTFASLLASLVLCVAAAATSEDSACMLQLGRKESQQAPTSVFVGVKSAPMEHNQQRRANWRKSCVPKYQAAGWHYKFFVGMPWDQGHDLTANKLGNETELELQMQKDLLKEVEEFQDIVLLPMRDCYQDLSNKLIGLFQHGVHKRKEEYIMEQDDDVCGNVSAIEGVIKRHEKHDADSFLYAGRELDDRNITFGPYYWGMISLVSRGLAEIMFDTDAAHSILTAAYSGSNEDDTNFGLWVKYAMDHHGAKVNFETELDFTSDEAVETAQMEGATEVMSLVTAARHR
eukprot:gb/GFBE01007882.1/.p1 GENE.gb/GFBE01007882.1/~~gb/GFBE01007882.1/.p1  ORF type:complete len:287 (+),score=74.02 gb/GFBE01007882.1/:1-861(+)